MFHISGWALLCLTHNFVVKRLWMSVFKKIFNDIAFLMYCSGKMLTLHRLTAGDDVKVPEHALIHTVYIEFNHCRILDLEVLCVLLHSLSLIVLKLYEGF